MSIVVSHLSKFYGSQKAVDNISFSISKGEVVGFLGPNGAGKSTTMKMITGYIPCSEGEIMVCDEAVSVNDITTKRKIGYLPEANPLYMDMYVREYLRFVAGVHQLKSIRLRVEDVIQTVGLTPESSKKIGQLSKGYKQRVGLAAALIHDPEVLILDEPTSGLDPNQIIEIRELIKRLGENKTVLFSSHIMQEVEAVCQRAIIINKGKMVADEKLSNLKQSNRIEQELIVSFKEQVDMEMLRNGFTQDIIQKASDHTFVFITQDADTTRKKLMEFCIANNITIQSMQDSKDQLTQVFKNLTTGN